MLDTPGVIALAGVCAFGAVSISVVQILCHLRNYTEPLFQRYIIRLIFMVPVYALGSWFSLRYRHSAIYFDTVRDCYEAWIIYNFTSLLLAYVGGPGAVVVKAEGKVVHPSWVHLTCCLPAMQPLMAALTLVLYAANAYTDGDMSPKNGYFYLPILYNVSYTFALYGLLLFWIGAGELLAPFSPLLKFVLVKTVVFLTFWQGIAISAINSMGHIEDPEDGKALQNLMICAEMLVAGAALTYAFPHKEYSIGGSAAGFRLDAFAHAASMRDVVKDVVHVFAPTYSDYVLYSDGGPADHVKRKKFRGQKGATPDGRPPPPGRNFIKSVARTGLAGLDGVFDAAGGLAGGRRGRGGPQGGGAKKAEQAMERNRNMAALLDSDSDAMDSDEEAGHAGGHIGTEVTSSPSSSDESHSGDDASGEEGARSRGVRGRGSGAAPPRGKRRATETSMARGALPNPEAAAGPASRRVTFAEASTRAAGPRRRMKLLSSSDDSDAGGCGGGGEGGGEGGVQGKGEEAGAPPQEVVAVREPSPVAQLAQQPHAQLRRPLPNGQQQPQPPVSAAGQQAAAPASEEGDAPARLPSPPSLPLPIRLADGSQNPKQRASPISSHGGGSGGGGGGGGGGGACAAAPEAAVPIGLPPPKPSAQRLAAARAAAAATDGQEGPPLAWAARGWTNDAGQQ
ncbi:Transmembrane protein [Monoraphidium neglectum]|uniref:Transmembrane protein n=1 Tax=Monoraphidium neglectum TaxID=145388 RepID=A0A0D2NM59_9CHLO|nr:Transmembrane protein [Monoraphidium neglectum]KIZ05721.1 Transmembrane protein [Monoraphidium neglectum]|eukprot:XP_013904740.1 Transmembrane protein [Monoraphidium neglectum]